MIIPVLMLADIISGKEPNLMKQKRFVCSRYLVVASTVLSELMAYDEWWLGRRLEYDYRRS